MKQKNLLLVICAVLGLTACTGDFYTEGRQPWDDDTTSSDLDYDDEKEQEDNNHTSTGGTTEPLPEAGATTDDLTSFDVVTDGSALAEAETVPSLETDPLYEDYVENYTVQKTVRLVWSGSSVTASGDTDAVTISVDGGDVAVTSAVKGMKYVLEGNGSDGMFSLYSDYKSEVELNGLTLANADGPAINIQTGKRTYVVLADGTGSNLSDGTPYASSSEDRKGTFFSEGQLCFSGKGTLNVSASYKNGIASDDYIFLRPGPVVNVTSSGTNGIKVNDYIRIVGGVLNVEVSSLAGKGISSDGYARIDGGRTTVITSGSYDADDDYATAACVKTDSIFVMNAGSLLCKSTGKGGKGIKSDMNAYFNGGTVRVVTTGADYGSSGNMWGGSSSTASARPKGIRVEGKLFINGGDIMVRVASHEGVESKSYIEINGGRLMVQSYDDAINSAGELVFNGGAVYARGTSNDGFDSNGNMTFNGGVAIAVGPSNGAECGIDVNEEGRAYITMNGGTVVGLGAGSSTPSYGTQYSILYGKAGMGGGGFGGGMGGGSSASVTAGTAYAVTDAEGNAVLVFRAPSAGSSLFMSSPDFAKGSSYSFLSGVTVAGGTEFCGLVTGASVSGGTTVGTSALSSLVTTIGGSGSGGRPGW